MLRPKSPDRCLVQTRKRLEPEDGNEVRDERGTTRSKPTLLIEAGVKGRLYHLTAGGLIGVRRRGTPDSDPAETWKSGSRKLRAPKKDR
jgi:hypothetical protein